MPRPREDVRLHEHRHVAPHAVAELGDSRELDGHRHAQVRVAIVELQRVGPAREVGVAPVREDRGAPTRAALDPVLRVALEGLARAVDEVLGVLVEPRMIERHMIDDVVEDERDPPLGKPAAEPPERFVAAPLLSDAVGADRER